MSATTNPTGAQDRAVIVITGASRGIGAAVVERLAKDAGVPTHLVVNYVSDSRAADAVVAAAQRAPNVTASPVQADVSQPDEVARLFAAADEPGPVVGLVNNAGIVYPIGSFLDMKPDRLERVWAVNITGSFLCAQEAVKRMSTAAGGQGGSIVNVSSRAASFGSPNEFIDYAASKGAIDTFTTGLSTEFADQGIRVNAVRPGLIETDIHIAAGVPDRVKKLASKIPMQRGGHPAEVANLICWLLSDEASYVTGSLMDVGGGR